MSSPDIKRAVTFALNADVRLDPQSIIVNAQDSKVFLKGTVSNHWQKRVAEDIATRIEGVSSVTNDLQVMPQSQKTDAEIEEAVLAALVRDVWVDADDIEVQVVGSVVYLTGIVDSLLDKDMAEEDSWSIRGVSAVVNRLAIVPSVIKPDDQIENEIRRKVEKDKFLKDLPLEIRVQNGVVNLSGTAGAPKQRALVADLARHTPGVVEVVDETGEIAA